MKSIDAPLPLTEHAVSEMVSGRYQAARSADNAETWLVHYQKHGESEDGWELCFRVFEEPVEWSDFQQTTTIYAKGLDEKAAFLSQYPIVGKKTRDGACFDVVIGTKYRRYANIGSTGKRAVESMNDLSPIELRAILKARFGLNLTLKEVEMALGAVSDEESHQVLTGFCEH